MSWIGRAIHFLEMTFIGFAAMCLAVAQAFFGLIFWLAEVTYARSKSCESRKVPNLGPEMEMVVSPKHPKMITFGRKTYGCWVPPF